MTFILGSFCRDGLVLVADRKITIGYGEDYDYCDKLFGEIRHVVYGSSGVTTMFELFRGHVMNYVSTHPGEITYQNATMKLSQFAFDIYKKYDFDPNFYFEVLVGIQPPDRPPTLNFISAYGQPRNIRTYHVIGSGASYAKVFLKKCLLDVTNMSLEQVAEIGCFIIKYIEEFKLNYTVGGEPMIWFIENKSGEKTDYILKERRPEQFEQIMNRASDRVHKHDMDISGLFKP